MLRRTFLPIAVTATLLLGACGDDGDDDTSTAATTEQGSETTEAPNDTSGSADAPDSSGETVVEVSGDVDEKPEIALNGQEPVTDLVIQDIVEGDGPEVQPGDTVEVNYVGQTLDGNQFDASWDRGDTITFPLGQVIRGWQDGIPGMKVGTRRLLVIPGDQAYGPQGNPAASIGPDETLVFVVDLIAINP